MQVPFSIRDLTLAFKLQALTSKLQASLALSTYLPAPESANSHVDGAGECGIDAELAADGLAVCGRLEFVCSLEAAKGKLSAYLAHEIRAPLLETFIRLTAKDTSR